MGQRRMECSLLAPYDAYLVAPNFTVTPPAIIDVRPWVAWYTSANGWRWHGTIGLNRSSWYRWSATRRRAAAWMTPTVALNPWTWIHVDVPAAQHIHAICGIRVDLVVQRIPGTCGATRHRS